MRYIPDLIPARSRVLPDYFKGDRHKRPAQHTWHDALLWPAGIFFLMTALVAITHPLLFLLRALTGLVLIPPGHRLLEKKLRCKLTPKIRTMAALALCFCSVPLWFHYTAIDQREAWRQQLLDDKAAEKRAVIEKLEQQRKDSMAFYLTHSRQSEAAHKPAESARQLQYALAFAKTPEEKEEISKERTKIATTRSIALVSAGRYQAALPSIDSLLHMEPGNTELLYNRALCYSKTGKIGEAVTDLQAVIQAGNADAKKLYEKINPVRKRIVGYETLCCDGSTSDARGRGACSHHGGVCDWNHPVYEEYRKYE